MDRTHSLNFATLASILLSLWSTLPFAQKPDQKVLEKTAIEIKRKNDMFDAGLIASDQAAIAASFPVIHENFRMKGFDYADVNEAVATGWKGFRAIPGAVEPMRGEMFKARVISLGKLRIESKPGDANIFIDTVRQDERTDTSKWFAPGTYRIRLVKDGYFAEEESRKIVEGENPPIVKSLKPRRR